MAKNYKSSDWALNKYSTGIIYGFIGQTAEVTLEDCLADNPGSTEQDFFAVKALSDELFHEQDISDNAYARQTGPLYEDSDKPAFTSPTLEQEYEEALDKQAVRIAAEQLLTSGELTKKQERRFRLHFYDGLTHRQIAAQEGVYRNAVAQSINSAVDKLKNYFVKYSF